MTHPGIAQLWKPVVNVTDLDEGERFWSELAGLTPQGRHGSASGDEYTILRANDPAERGSWILLQLVPEREARGHGVPISTSASMTWSSPSGRSRRSAGRCSDRQGSIRTTKGRFSSGL